MIKIYPRIRSMIGATLDRYDVRYAKYHNFKNDIDKAFIKRLVEKTGKSSNNPVKMLRNWVKAYKVNLKKNMMINNIKNIIRRG